MMEEAGFVDVEVVGEGRYEVGLDSLPADSSERDAFAAVTSIKVRALKKR